MLNGCQFGAPYALVRESDPLLTVTSGKGNVFRGINGIPRGKPEKTKSVENASNAWNSHANREPFAKKKLFLWGKIQ